MCTPTVYLLQMPVPGLHMIEGVRFGCALEEVTPPSWMWPAVSAAIGIAMCVSAHVDALSALGVEITVPFIGQAITGLLVSRGSSFLHDIWDSINRPKDAQEEETRVAKQR